jgi:hypothetical protein
LPGPRNRSINIIECEDVAECTTLFLIVVVKT